MRMRWLLAPASLFLVLSLGCSDDGTADSDNNEEESGTAESEESGGDGDPTSGDGDPTTGDGDPTTGDGDPTTGDGDPTTGDGDPTTGDGDPTTGDGDPGCPVGAEGCPCTGGGGCDPGLMCVNGICEPPPPQPDPYGACPSGMDDECRDDEICITGQGGQQQIPWSLCTHPCMDQMDCDVDDMDGCGDLQGDGQFMNYCSPVYMCGFGNPCPQGMMCFAGFQQQNPAMCMWI